MKTKNTIAAVAALMAVLGATTAFGDGTQALEAKVAELEAQQRETQAQMQRLMELLESKQQAPAATVTGGADRVSEVERKQGVITKEVRKLKESLLLPEEKELKSQYGLGPAASKVYAVNKGLSLGGYGEFNFKNIVSDKGSSRDEFDAVRLVLYSGYKFSDRILFNSEIEIEHASSGKEGEISVEFAHLDFMLHKKANVRVGLMLVPMGFLNEFHEPTLFHGNDRPVVEKEILPSTWRSGGIGLFGELLPGLRYRSYLVTGLDAKGFKSSGIRGGRQSGSKELAEDWAWVGRADYSPVPMLTLSGSAYLGNSGQNQKFGNDEDGFTTPDVFTQIYEVHGELKTHGFEARLLGAWSEIDDTDALNLDSTINPASTDPAKKDQPVASGQYGWYGELAYNVLPLFDVNTQQYLAPWFRYSQIDTQQHVGSDFTADPSRDRDIFGFGLTWKPNPQVVIKADYRNDNSSGGERPDEVRIGAGFIY